MVTRHFFGTATVVALLLALLFAAVPLGIAAPIRWPLSLCFAALAALAALSMRSNRARMENLVGLAAMASILAIALAATLLDWGIAAPGIGFFGLLTCMVCAVTGWRAGVAMALLSALVVVGLAVAQQQAWLSASHAAVSADSLALRTLVHLLVIGAGLAGGALVSRVVSRYVKAAELREQRFRALLAIAADAYWEIDAQARLVTFHEQARSTAGPGISSRIGQVAWDVPELQMDEDTLDLLRAHIEAREPFHDLPAQWLGQPDAPRHYVFSGEPRFTAGAVFCGYWGVARDVSADVLARQTLAATESRYQELFTRIPTPLVLHTHGHVLDANPAALDTFGFADLQAMLGQDLLAVFEGGDSRERARRRLEALLEQGAGEALPVAEFRLQLPQGRRMVVRATGVRVDAHGAPAVLSIFVDDTERKKAEDAVRRSEAMLSHLVATSPDVITLTDLATGRYAMVNRMFERQTGYRAADVVGRTSIELGIWRRPQDREHFVGLIREHGQVQDMPTEFVAQSGATLSMLVSGARFVMDRRDYLVINGRDVSASERSRLEREAILQNASIGIAVTRDQRFVLTNPRFEQIYGWPSGALVGQSGRVVWDNDEDYAHIGTTLGPLLARGESAEIETPARRFDGSVFLARITGRAIDPTHPAGGGTIWIVEDITERRQVEQALAKARDAAEAANQAKSRFLANTSHELRTPLNHLLGLSRMAAAADADEAQRRQHLVQIGLTAEALAAVMVDILDLSRIEAGKLQVESVAFDLGELLLQLQRHYTMMADTRPITISLQVDAGADGPVRGDPLRTRQILGNYLSNALKFTAQGEVRLLARRVDAQRVRFEVQDTGPGIEAATLQRLFRPFTQADESTTRRYGGTGLGLSICHELAALMGGKVGVHSRLGQGSCFWVEVPLPVSEPPSGDAPLLGDGADVLSGAWVLLVEDDRVNMIIAAQMLGQWGVRVEQAGDGAQALAAVQHAARQGRPFDAVLMDVQMPVMSGHEATRQLRLEFSAQKLPVIALTAATSEREQALAAGMNDFLTKPIEEKRLKRSLRRWIATRSDTR